MKAFDLAVLSIGIGMGIVVCLLTVPKQEVLYISSVNEIRNALTDEVPEIAMNVTRGDVGYVAFSRNGIGRGVTPAEAALNARGRGK
jgi:hypothetical protein